MTCTEVRNFSSAHSEVPSLLLTSADTKKCARPRPWCKADDKNGDQLLKGCVYVKIAQQQQASHPTTAYGFFQTYLQLSKLDISNM